MEISFGRQGPIQAATRFGGLIGRGISYSLSPFIHNHSAKLLGIDAVYHIIDLEVLPDRDYFEGLLQTNCYGFNVTVPFKEGVAGMFPASKLQSVNTLVNRNTYWDALSTDGEGFLLGLRDVESDLADFEAVICLGYGGSAKALLATIGAKAPELSLFALRRSDLDDNERIQMRSFTPEALGALISMFPNSLVIQCTNAPLNGDDLSRFCESIKGLKGAFVDLVYGRRSALFSFAQQEGIKAQDGIPMLVAQALLSQKLWWGQSADFSAMKAALRSHMAKGNSL